MGAGGCLQKILNLNCHAVSDGWVRSVGYTRADKPLQGDTIGWQVLLSLFSFAGGTKAAVAESSEDLEVGEAEMPVQSTDRPSAFYSHIWM